MRKILILFLFLFVYSAAKCQQTYFTTPPTGYNAFTPSFRFKSVTPDSLMEVVMFNPLTGKYFSVYTATKTNIKYQKISDTTSLFNQLFNTLRTFNKLKVSSAPTNSTDVVRLTDLSSFVPYTGATNSVDIGNHDLIIEGTALVGGEQPGLYLNSGSITSTSYDMQLAAYHKNGFTFRDNGGQTMVSISNQSDGADDPGLNTKVPLNLQYTPTTSNTAVRSYSVLLRQDDYTDTSGVLRKYGYVTQLPYSSFAKTSSVDSTYFNKKDNLSVFSFNQVSNVGGAVIPFGVWDANFREIGNVIWDSSLNLYITCYSGYIAPYSETGAVYIGIASSPDGKTWTKRGPEGNGRAFTFKYGEDPYLVKVGNQYRIYFENKSVVPQDISLATTTNIDGAWSDGGTMIGSGAPGSIDAIQASSPTVYKDASGTWYMYYEAQSNLSSRSGKGLTSLATSADGLTWVKTNDLILSTANVPWSASTVPDDIIKVDDKYYLFFHGQSFNSGGYYMAGVAVSNDLINWSDLYGKSLPQDQATYTRDSNTLMVWPFGDAYKVNYVGPNGIYSGFFSTRGGSQWTPNNNVMFDDGATGFSSDGINEVYNSIQTANRTLPFYADSLGVGPIGVNKVFRNTTIYTLTVTLKPGVTVDGSTSSLSIPPGESRWLFSTAANTWVTINNLQIPSITNGTGNFATFSTTGALRQRTPSQVKSDIGISSNIDILSTSTPGSSLNAQLSFGLAGGSVYPWNALTGTLGIQSRGNASADIAFLTGSGGVVRGFIKGSNGNLNWGVPSGTDMGYTVGVTGTLGVTGAITASNYSTNGVAHFTGSNGTVTSSLIQPADLAASFALPNGTTATTQAAGDNSTKVATTAFITTATQDVISVATDANYTITSAGQLIKLPVVTANRTVSIPAASSYTGRIIRIWNQNTSGTFNWSFTGGTVKDAANNTLTTVINTSVYVLESDGSVWLKIN